MRTPYLICSVCGLAIGGVAGYFIGISLDKAKAAQETQLAINELRDHYETKYSQKAQETAKMELVEASEEDETEVPDDTSPRKARNEKTPAEKRALGYTNLTKLYNKPPLASDDTQPAEPEDAEDDEDVIEEENDPLEVFFITDEEFEMPNGADKYVYTHYRDGIVVDEDDIPVDDLSILGGDKMLERLSSEGVVYVHNDTFNCDYKILTDDTDF